MKAALAELLHNPLLWQGDRLARAEDSVASGFAALDRESLAFVFTGTARAAHPSPAPLRIRLSLVEEKLRIDVFKRRGGVMTRPLLLDVSASSVNIKNPISHAMEDVPPATAMVRP